VLSEWGSSLLDSALHYAIGNVRAVTPDRLSARTPCGEWDLRELLVHTTDSLAVLHAGLDTGFVAPLGAADAVSGADVVAAFDTQARALLEQLGRMRPGPEALGAVAVGDRQLHLDLLAATLSLEIAVHGWDVSQACGRSRPIPSALASEMLFTSSCVVTDDVRPMLFGPPVATAPTAGPSDRLLAFLGRDPGL
jgi:uncharacterized protein (TIGR03086 family)